MLPDIKNLKSKGADDVVEKLKKAYNFLSFVNREAYKDIFLLSNQVLSKNPYTNNFMDNFLQDKEIIRPSFGTIILKLLKYYFVSFKKFIIYLIEFIIFSLNSVDFLLSKDCNELILTDTFFIVKKIKESDKYEDLYFPGLRNVLNKTNKYYAYLPVFGGFKKITDFQVVLKILKRDKIPILSEYQLLSLGDLARIFHFILTYPFHVFKFLKSLHSDNYEVILLKSELINTLHLDTFSSFSRYLQGKRIANLPYINIKVISWYENQVIHKNLYKGLKENNSKVTIYGAQLFLYPNSYLNVFPDENEKIFGIVPDKIIVNGPIFVPRDTKLNYSVGPSLRYSRVFNRIIKKENRKKILILLPYSKEDSKNILGMVSQLRNVSQQLFVKTHPAVSMIEVKDILPQNIFVVDDDIYNLFDTTRIIISVESGVIVEATSLGIPAVVIKNNQRYTHNPLLEYGRGVIWEEVSNSAELNQCVCKFDIELERNLGAINDIASEYRKMFFCEPNEENIIRAFEL